MTASDTRVEEGANEYAGKFYGYAKRYVIDDPDDLYAYRYEETGPHKTAKEAQDAADKLLARIRREPGQKHPPQTNAAFEEGGAGLRLEEIRKQDNNPERLKDTGER
jgi:hypothetical protein